MPDQELTAREEPPVARCARCDWPLAKAGEVGCTADVCSCVCSQMPRCRCGENVVRREREKMKLGQEMTVREELERALFRRLRGLSRNDKDCASNLILAVVTRRLRAEAAEYAERGRVRAVLLRLAEELEAAERVREDGRG